MALASRACFVGTIMDILRAIRWWGGCDYLFWPHHKHLIWPHLVRAWRSGERSARLSAFSLRYPLSKFDFGRLRAKAATLIQISAQDVASVATAGAAAVTAWMALSTRAMAKQARRSADAGVDAVKNAERELQLLASQNHALRAQNDISRSVAKRATLPLLVPILRADDDDFFRAHRVPAGDGIEIRYEGQKLHLLQSQLGSWVLVRDGLIWVTVCLKNIGLGPARLAGRLRSNAADALGLHFTDNGQVPFHLTACEWEPQDQIVEAGGSCVFAVALNSSPELFKLRGPELKGNPATASAYVIYSGLAPEPGAELPRVDFSLRAVQYSDVAWELLPSGAFHQGFDLL